MDEEERRQLLSIQGLLLKIKEMIDKFLNEYQIPAEIYRSKRSKKGAIK